MKTKAPDFSETSPIDYAKERYSKQNISFDEKMEWYLDNGWVVSTPELFAMGYLYFDEGTVCFIEACVGSITDLLRYSINNLDFLEFHRDFSDQPKRYDYKRFVSRI